MRILTGLKTATAMMMLAAIATASASAPEANGVTRETLGNGLRVVVIRNTLAPVVTVEMNFMVGGNETPAGFPGNAHALEHMNFRGCTGMTADQTSTIYAQLSLAGRTMRIRSRTLRSSMRRFLRRT
jgi:predicted Zn-dependent peptidase